MNEAYKKGISSYALIILVIAFYEKYIKSKKDFNYA